MNKITRSILAALLLVGGLPILKAEDEDVEISRRGEARIKAAVEAGRISKEDAQKRLSQMRKAGGANEAKGDGRGFSVEDYRRAEEKIKAAVEAGRVSKKDAEKRLIEMRKAIGADKAKGDGRGIRVDDYRRGEVRIKAAV